MALNIKSTEVERRGHLLRFLEREIWSKIPADQLGREHDVGLDDQILGYGPHGTRRD